MLQQEINLLAPDIMLALTVTVKLHQSSFARTDTDYEHPSITCLNATLRLVTRGALLVRTLIIETSVLFV